jgi:methanogenic corrinoid protein MtbC1
MGPSGAAIASNRHDVAVQRLADQVVVHLADRLHPDPDEPRGAPVSLEAFCAALLDGDDTLALSMVRQGSAAELSLRRAYFDILAPASHRLGEMWENDEIGFLQLSMATGRIFSIMRVLRREVLGRAQPARPGALALFAAVPGEEHTMAVTMAADLFREAGWHVDLRAGAGEATILADAERTDYPVIGLSASHPGSAAALVSCVRGLRRVSPSSRIVLAGHAVEVMPGLGKLAGVDAAMADFDAVLAVCEDFVAQEE